MCRAGVFVCVLAGGGRATVGEWDGEFVVRRLMVGWSECAAVPEYVISVSVASVVVSGPFFALVLLLVIWALAYIDSIVVLLLSLLLLTPTSLFITLP